MRMAVVVFAALSASAAAQQPQPIHLIVEAADQAGNEISGVYVSAQLYTDGAQKIVEAHTDGNGEASLDLLPGTYTFVALDGCSMMWTQKMKVSGTDDVAIAINAVLKPGTIIDCAEITTEPSGMQLLPPGPEASIPLHEMRLLPVSSKRRHRL